MKRKILFISCDGALIRVKTCHNLYRDGTLEKELANTDALEQLRFLPGVIRNVYFIRKNLDFDLVLILNQEKSGTTANHLQKKILELLAGEGITFDNILSLPTLQQESYLTGDYDLINSYVIGYQEADIQLAEIIGCKCILLFDCDDTNASELHHTRHASVATHKWTSWDQIKEFLFAGERQATVQRTTNETDVYIRLNLDGNGVCDISTGIGFFNHMLEQIGKHGGLDLTVKVKGDLNIDEHHTVEDTAIALGEAVCQVLSDKRGIERYGYCLPMDDCLCTLALDFGGRSWLVWDAQFKRERVGDMPTEMFSHFFKSFSDAAKMNLHIKAEGENEHHKAEGIFKAFAKAIKMAVKRDVYKYSLPSTKGYVRGTEELT